MTIVRCPIRGIAFDAELEDCPECARQPKNPFATGIGFPLYLCTRLEVFRLGLKTQSGELQDLLAPVARG